MSYYSGDFYKGDYYSGDPGIFSVLGRIGRAAAGFIPGVGGVVGKLGGLIHVGRTPGIISAVPRGGAMARIGEMAGAGGRMIARHPVLSAAGGAAVIGAAATAGVERMMAGPGGACPKGFHISRSKHAKHFGQCVRNRHMNVCNPRALRRSLRRAHGFARLAMKTIHLIHPKKKGRFGGFRRKRKRAA